MALPHFGHAFAPGRGDTNGLGVGGADSTGASGAASGLDPVGSVGRVDGGKFGGRRLGSSNRSANLVP